MRSSKIRIPVLLSLLLLCTAIFVKAETGEQTDIVYNIPDTSAVEISSNRHTQSAEKDIKVQSIADLENFEKKLENNTLEIWFNQKTASIRIVDKRSGYIWGFVGTEKPGNLNKSWFGMANSLCTIDYYDKKGAEKKISLSSGDIKKEYVWNKDSLECRMDAAKLGISLSFSMTLKGEQLTFSVLDKSLVEKGSSKIKSIYFVPFLGTTQEDEIPGYMLVPDGPGALIRYAKAVEYSSGFSKKVYGADIGIDSLEAPSGMMASRSDDYLVDEPQISMPVYGIVHGPDQNAVLAVLKSGVEYATIIANVSGITTNYNWIAARFDYRQSYMHPTTKEGTGVYLPQEDYNILQPEISFYFLTGDEADYSGMAVYYRKLLEKEGVFHTERVDTVVPVRLDILGADVKKGFLHNPLKTFTTVNATEGILADLNNLGISNITTTYRGWQRGGINGSKFGERKFEPDVGKQKDFVSLKQQVEAGGGRFYLYLDPVIANSTQLNRARQAAITLSKTYAMTKSADEQVMFPETYYIKPDITLELLSESKDKSVINGFAYDSIGYILYSDYTRNHFITRPETLASVTDFFKTMSGALALYRPNQYLWQYTEEYFDIPMVSSQYLYETDTVPFLQIVLKGHIDYYAPYANLGFYSVNSILKMIEYGTYPSFIIAAAQNHELTDTPEVDLFTVNFDDWKGSIQSIYSQINASLSRVEGSTITKHEVVAPGVVSVLYDNGIVIYVNYTSTAFKTDDVMVPALGFAVAERQE